MNSNYQQTYEDYMNYKKINKKALDLYSEQMEILCNLILEFEFEIWIKIIELNMF